jgi:hypothetical protein
MRFRIADARKCAPLALILTACASGQGSQLVNPQAAPAPGCIGQITTNRVQLLGQEDREIPLPAPFEWSAEGFAEGAGRVLSSTSELDLERMVVRRLDEPIPGRILDVSSDGSRVLWVGRDSANSREGVFVLERPTKRLTFITESAERGLLSDDGLLIAVAFGKRVTVFKEGRAAFTAQGDFPSWLDNTTLSYLRNDGDYEFVDISTGIRRRYEAEGRPFTPLWKSAANGHLMYLSRTRRDFWSLDFSCPERYRVMVHSGERGSGVVFDFGCKGSPAMSTRWIDNDRVCSAKR